MRTDIVVAADVGGTRMRAALVGPDGTVLLRRAVATPTDADVPAALIDLLEAVSKERALGAPSHAVVGLPGSVDYEPASCSGRHISMRTGPACSPTIA